jgi:hypothetical protein|uniref:DUF3108 domain-containing protein n=1 Tax=Cephaloticoccus sp. TaxID=1985742 RepID=UPI00404AD94F
MERFFSFRWFTRLLLLGFVGLVPDGNAETTPVALGDGEELTFRVGWGIFTGAGEIKIGADLESTDTASTLHVNTTTTTKGFLKNFFPFVAQADAYFDPHSGLLLHSTETSKSKRKETRQSLSFNYQERVASYLNEVEPEKSKDVIIPAGEPMDLITSLVQTRSWNLAPGEKQDALVIFDDDFYELTIYAEAYETLRTPLGEFKTLVLVPKMEKTEPKGMFKRGSTVRVWISQDERKLPVRFEVEFKFGAGVATLVAYQASKPNATVSDQLNAGQDQDCTTSAEPEAVAEKKN